MHNLTQHPDRFRRPRTLMIASALLLTVLIASILTHPFTSHAAAAGSPQFSDFPTYVTWMQSHHKAPFDRDVAISEAQGGEAFVKQTQGKFPLATASSTTTANIKVNQDRNPWPKAEVGAAVNPANGNDYVVMTNDFRENFDHQFYHVSTDGGQHFTDDSMTVGSDVAANNPYSFQSDPGVAFDSVGHSFITNISGNQILYYNKGSGYSNLDTEIDLVQGFANGQYTNNFPTPIDFQPCGSFYTSTTATSNCPAVLDKPLITVDTVPGSPNKGTIYVYYTLFCNASPCVDGNATIPANSSAILEAHAAGAGLPFSPPNLVSGSLPQGQFSDLVVDSHGIPHIFFDDFSDPLAVNMYESTLSGGTWVTHTTPVATFTYNSFNGLNNPNNWQFRALGAVAPGCGISKDTAYCAFSSVQIGSGKREATPSVYIAKVNTLTDASTISRVNNDAFGDEKDHFFAWASPAPNGAVYVGWYDNRNDPFNAKVEYFVGKSTDGGATFPTQKAVSTTSFNPCTGFPGCGFFGDYTQLITGPDGVTHAAWSDTRDGASMQIYSARITQ